MRQVTFPQRRSNNSLQLMGAPPEQPSAGNRQSVLPSRVVEAVCPKTKKEIGCPTDLQRSTTRKIDGPHHHVNSGDVPLSMVGVRANRRGASHSRGIAESISPQPADRLTREVVLVDDGPWWKRRRNRLLV